MTQDMVVQILGGVTNLRTQIAFEGLLLKMDHQHVRTNVWQIFLKANGARIEIIRAVFDKRVIVASTVQSRATNLAMKPRSATVPLTTRSIHHRIVMQDEQSFLRILHKLSILNYIFRLFSLRFISALLFVESVVAIQEFLHRDSWGFRGFRGS